MSATLVRQLARFCMVGGIGFVFDAGALWLLLAYTDMGPYIARALSFVVAATVTWSLHRRFTFPEAHRGRLGRQWLHFVAVNGGGALVNYGVYALLIATTVFFASAPLLALAAGCCVALFVNFTANRIWVFRDAP